ncbi:MAG TPA: hypothetical protein VHP83_18720 [Aggregatilineaceae bacterium]|nr:hypothetical protein [Aggregatilineaceae bacterium]
MVAIPTEIPITIRRPHPQQDRFIYSKAKRKVIRAGRRGGKTVGAATLAVLGFMAGQRVLYAAPTIDQVERFWYEVKNALNEAVKSKALYKNETEHLIERPGTLNRIRAKTAWNADTLRGDYADLLILDEYQLMSEDAWGVVGAPMLADNNGDAVFIYTPPSLHSRSRTKARDPQHAAKMFKRAQDDTTRRWAAFHFTSFDNPHISKVALDDLAGDMTAQAYQQEILAEDIDAAPGALWKRDLLEELRLWKAPDFGRIVIGVDPPGGRVECGIVAGGLGSANRHGYVIADASFQGSPGEWGLEVVRLYHALQADCVVVEANFGGDMVKSTVQGAPGGEHIRIKEVHASRGKAVRAEPIAAKYEHKMVHHVGQLLTLENELCLWEPNTGMASPNRMDALVWALTDLMLSGSGGVWNN